MQHHQSLTPAPAPATAAAATVDSHLPTLSSGSSSVTHEPPFTSNISLFHVIGQSVSSVDVMEQEYP